MSLDGEHLGEMYACKHISKKCICKNAFDLFDEMTVFH